MDESEQKKSYRSFCESVRETVHQRMGADYEVTVHTVIKNNNVQLDSLIIRKEHTLVMPSIYLNGFYEEYTKGKEWEEIIGEILQFYEQNQLNCTGGFTFGYENLKEHIVYRLISYERNREMLEEAPHIRVGDLAITFHCMVLQGEECLGAVRVTNEHLEHWGVSGEEIYACAKVNTPKLLPPRIRTMDEVMDEILWERLRKNVEEHGSPETTQEYMRMIVRRQEEEPLPMYILSNSRGNYGAAAILELEYMDAFYEAGEEDFYILPSSVHEMILIPVSRAPEISRLQEMVRDINETQVPEQEFLSNQVLRYSDFCQMLSAKTAAWDEKIK